MCRAAWRGKGGVRPQTQSSIAVSSDRTNWAVFNCSPDIRQQIQATPALHPRDPARHGPRDTAIHSVVLTNADVDHLAGLVILREKQAFTVFATPKVINVIQANPIFNVLDPAFVKQVLIAPGETFSPAPGVEATLFPVPGKVALFMENPDAVADGTIVTDAEGEDTVGIHVRAPATGSNFFYVPGCARVSDAVADRLRGAELVLFDGTMWENEEMKAKGVGHKSGARMGHMSMNGPEGSMAAFEALNVHRKVFIHINNTNPVWDPASAARKQVDARGWTIAQDGMEIEL